MNTLDVATTGTVHATSADVETTHQVRVSTACSRRQVYGYVHPYGVKTVNCPRCLAKQGDAMTSPQRTITDRDVRSAVSVTVNAGHGLIGAEQAIGIDIDGITEEIIRTDPGPLPADALTDPTETVRARKIAAIHALAQFYVDHPHVPMPTNVLAFTTTYAFDTGNEIERVNAVLDFAALAGVEPQETFDKVSARQELVRIDGLTVAVSMAAYVSPPPATYRRYTA